MNTYYLSCKYLVWTQVRTLREMKRHGRFGEEAEFLEDMGDKEEYAVQSVLDWLGYIDIPNLPSKKD